jgi:hypothetical protein
VNIEVLNMSDIQLLAREAEGLPHEIIAELLSLARLFKREEAARYSAPPRAETAWVNPLKGLCKGTSLTLDRFMKMQRDDLELENAGAARLWNVK